ncbi:MAG: hypothetical protein QXK06_02150 [Candidatus Diapherotrites archaeon]
MQSSFTPVMVFGLMAFLLLAIAGSLFLLFFGHSVFGWEKSPLEVLGEGIMPFNKTKYYEGDWGQSGDYVPESDFKKQGYRSYPGLSQSDSMHYDNATKSLDSSECLLVENENYRHSCIFTVAKVSKNPESCALIGSASERDNCYLSLSFDLPHTGLCEKIESEKLKEQCLEHAIKRAREPLPECETMEEAKTLRIGLQKQIAINECYNKKAVEAGDIKLCERARDAQFCIAEYSSQLSREKALAECKRLSLEEHKNACFFAAGICEQISNDVSSRERCLVNRLVFSTDVNQCAGLTIAYEKGKCYSFVARNTSNPSVCELLEGDNSIQDTATTSKENCYYFLAEGKEENLWLCQKILDKDYKSSCISLIAINSRKTEYCDMLQQDNNVWFQQCYSGVAQIEKNPVLCEKISDKQMKNYCLALATGDSSYCNWLAEYEKETCYLNVQNRK